MTTELVPFPHYQDALRELRVCESIICDEALAGHLPTADLVASHAELKATYEMELGYLAGRSADIRYEL